MAQDSSSTKSCRYSTKVVHGFGKAETTGQYRLVAPVMAKRFNLQKFIRDPKVVWYGPHECDGCNDTVVKSSIASGGITLDAGSFDHNYPNFKWQKHKCKNTKYTR